MLTWGWIQIGLLVYLHPHLRIHGVLNITSLRADNNADVGMFVDEHGGNRHSSEVPKVQA